MVTGVEQEDPVRSFAQRIENFLTALFGSRREEYTTVESAKGRSGKIQYYSIRNKSDNGVALQAEKQNLVFLKYDYLCFMDDDSFLTVSESSISVTASNKTEPFFHYDYLRNPESGEIPTAHINIHAANDDLVRTMLQCGSKNRGKKRRKGFIERGAFPTVSTLHFPVGGNLFRPSLEDVIQMIICEFGIDVSDNWDKVIMESRQEYRIRQFKALVREHPEIAAAELQRLGCELEVETLPAPHNGALDRLTAY